MAATGSAQRNASNKASHGTLRISGFELNTLEEEPEMKKMGRPLNSWMAFRSYYIGLFAGLQQKEVSTYLNMLWQQDPFRTKWAILARAYTMVRDKVGKKWAPLDKYLALICPAVGIIAVSEYFDRFNWEVKQSADGTLSLTQVSPPNLATFGAAERFSSMTEADVLQYLIDQRYLPSHKDFIEALKKSAEHVMVTSATMSPRKAKQAFKAAIHNDPTAVAAHILGLPLDHPFLNVATDMRIMPKKQLPVSGAFIPDTAHIFKPAQVYAWTGSLNDLYIETEPEIDLDDSEPGNEWSTTSIVDPVVFDEFLEDAGFEPDFLLPDYPVDPEPQYNFGDSF